MNEIYELKIYLDWLIPAPSVSAHEGPTGGQIAGHGYVVSGFVCGTASLIVAVGMASPVN